MTYIAHGWHLYATLTNGRLTITAADAHDLDRGVDLTVVRDDMSRNVIMEFGPVETSMMAALFLADPDGPANATPKEESSA